MGAFWTDPLWWAVPEYVRVSTKEDARTSRPVGAPRPVGEGPDRRWHDQSPGSCRRHPTSTRDEAPSRQHWRAALGQRVARVLPAPVIEFMA
jgi:hypothetical protein